MKKQIQLLPTYSRLSLVALTLALAATFSQIVPALADGQKETMPPAPNLLFGSESSDGNALSERSPASQNLNGGSVSPIQAKERPFGLNIAGQVMQAGSDSASAKFQTVLPGMLQFIKSYLPEAQNNIRSPLVFGIDPSRLTLSTESSVRAYFCNEGAGYHNTLGFNATGVGVSSGDPKIIFPDASSSIGYGGLGTGTRSASEPLLPGDFVNLGDFSAGTKLDFFLIANGANGGSSVFSTTRSTNPDGINHVATFSPTFWGMANSPYLFISYEDLWGGGDRDFNDVIIALDIGAANVARLVATPEPATWIIMGSLVGLVLWISRRRQIRSSKTLAVSAP